MDPKMMGGMSKLFGYTPAGAILNAVGPSDKPSKPAPAAAYANNDPNDPNNPKKPKLNAGTQVALGSGSL